MNIKYKFFKKAFFPSSIIEWNKLDLAIQNTTSFNAFKESIPRFIRPAPNSIFQCHNSKGIKYITRLRVNSSHLREHKFKHLFEDAINPFCTCGVEEETTNDFVLDCSYYKNERHILFTSIRSIKSSILDQNDNNAVKTLLYGLDILMKHRTQAF